MEVDVAGAVVVIGAAEVSPGSDGKLEDSSWWRYWTRIAGCTWLTPLSFMVRQHGITRDMQDEFALRSQKCADDATNPAVFRKNLFRFR